MTLDRLAPYDPGTVDECGGTAVVVGASMSGLCAARVLADAFEQVTVLEADSLPDTPAGRRGVPQSGHIHALHEAGRTVLSALFDGYSEELTAAGAEVIDVATDFRFYDEGDFVADGTERLPMYCASRPLFEHVTRQLLAETDGVRIRDDCHCTDYLTDDGTTIDGVEIRGSGPGEIRADLVVDATGRTSGAPKWLDAHGYESPPTDEVSIDLAYTTLRVNRPAGDRRAFYLMPCPPRRRGAGMLPAEGGEWILSLSGVHGDHPPTDVADAVAFAESLPVDAFAELIDRHGLATRAVEHYPFPSNRRHCYWELSEFPAGFVVVGDAIASFNPIYGQGMSVAALEALCLHHALAEGGLDRLGRRFFDRVEPVVEDAWSLAVSADFRFPETTGPKPTGTDLLNRYLGRLTRRSHDDAVLADAYSRVVLMERRPTTLLHPRIVWRVVRPSIDEWRARLPSLPAGDRG